MELQMIESETRRKDRWAQAVRHYVMTRAALRRDAITPEPTMPPIPPEMPPNPIPPDMPPVIDDPPGVAPPVPVRDPPTMPRRPNAVIKGQQSRR
jgi:hypothetical protein